MPCDTITISDGQTLQERGREVDGALDRLAAALDSGAVTLRVGPQGALCIVGWEDRRKISDTCAIRSLQVRGSWELRKAIARAEGMAGVKANMNAVASGLHSHDGGQSWGRG